MPIAYLQLEGGCCIIASGVEHVRRILLGKFEPMKLVPLHSPYFLVAENFEMSHLNRKRGSIAKRTPLSHADSPLDPSPVAARGSKP